MSNTTEHKSVHFLIKEDPTFSMFTASSSKYPLIEWMNKMERFADEHANKLQASLLDVSQKATIKILDLEKRISELENERVEFTNWILKNKSKNNIRIYDESDKWTFWRTGNAYGSQLTSHELYQEFKKDTQ